MQPRKCHESSSRQFGEAIQKPTNITALSDLSGRRPLCQVITAPKTKQINIDMHYVHDIDATGLNLFLSAVQKQLPSNPLGIKILPPHQSTARELFFSLNENIFNFEEESEKQPELPFYHSDETSSHDGKISKIIRIENRDEATRERSLASFRQSLKKFLTSISNARINKQQLLIIFSEMAKNTLDHSDRDATLGIDYCVHSPKEFSISFSYCEQGAGLVRSLRAALPEKESRLASKGGFSDLVYWAIKPGNTTKSDSGVNYGLGMAMIVAAANGLNLRIELIDAKSTASLIGVTEHQSHLELRRRYVASNNFPCFCYVGSMTVKQ